MVIVDLILLFIFARNMLQAVFYTFVESFNLYSNFTIALEAENSLHRFHERTETGQNVQVAGQWEHTPCRQMGCNITKVDYRTTEQKLSIK